VQDQARGLGNSHPSGSFLSSKGPEKLARLHARIANIRQDGLHKLTSRITRRFHPILVDELKVGGMVKNRHLAFSLFDMGFFEFRL